MVWISLAYILVWLILKMTGVINTPIWITYSPAIAGLFAIGGAFEKLRSLSKDTKEIKEKVDDIDKDIHIIRKKCPQLCK